MKKNQIFVAATCISLALSACGNTGDKEPAAVETKEQETVSTEEETEPARAGDAGEAEAKEEPVTADDNGENEAKEEPATAVDAGIYKDANEPSGDGENAVCMEAYKEFIDSKEGLYFDIYEADGYEKDRPYSLDEFFETKKKNSEPALYEYHDLEYADIDCGNDGVKELLIRYTVSGEMSEYEGDYVFENVIKYIDGRLEVCAEAVSHYRFTETVNRYGVIASGFIDFAGANVWSSQRGVDRDGKLHEIMDSSTSYAEAIPGMYSGFSDGEPDFTELSDMCNELGEDFYVYSTDIAYGSMKGQRVYSYELSGHGEYKDAIEDVFKNADVKLLQYDEYKKAIQSVIEEFGLTSETFNAGEPDFTAFPQTDDEKAKEPWKEAYEEYIHDLLTGKEYMHDEYEVYQIEDPNAVILIASEDITQDGIPELWVYAHHDENFVQASILSYEDGNRIFINDAMNWYYNPETKTLYAHEGGYAELFTAYKFENGSFVKDYELWNDESYYLINKDNEMEDISEEQANALIAEFEEGKAKYTLKPTEVSLSNFNDIF